MATIDILFMTKTAERYHPLVAACNRPFHGSDAILVAGQTRPKLQLMYGILTEFKLL